MAVDLQFPNLQQLIARQAKRHSTESRALLAWVLENIFRIDETEAEDCVCDGPDDKGVDALHVDESTETIEVFQCKLSTKPNRETGDRDLRDFAGTLTQFASPEAVERLRDSTGNHELKGRINELKVPDLIRQGYGVRGVFVTNSTLDANGHKFVRDHGGISALDNVSINELYVPAERETPATGRFEFDVSKYGFIQFVTPQGISVAIAPIPATQLVTLPGIESGALFEPNVRQSLGGSKVNRDIFASIRDKKEHPQFLVYHNGITMVCEKLTTSEKDGRIIASNIYVVNGCQSLSSFFQHLKDLTDDLCVFVKLVQVGRDSELLHKITYRSNNQNAIKARDFKSNHPLQVRLQNEFGNEFKGKVFYQIKRGEKPTAAQVIDNEFAAKLLLTVDLKQPYTAHQSYKLFDELYTEIFARREVNAKRIYVLDRIFTKVSASLDRIEDKLFANYSLTSFFILHLIAEALRTSTDGQEFLKDPSRFVDQRNGYEILDQCVGVILGDLITDINGELRDRAAQGHPLDFKRELKSATGVATLTRTIVGAYQKLVGRGRVASFGEEWRRVAAELNQTRLKL